jgi:hypothetical protein
MTTTVMFSYAFVQDLSDAMSEPHGTMVDVFSVVASVGPWDRQQYSPFGTREICLVVDLSVNTYETMSFEGALVSRETMSIHYVFRQWLI